MYIIPIKKPPRLPEAARLAAQFRDAAPERVTVAGWAPAQG